MSTSIKLTLTFDITKAEDADAPYEATLVSITPKGKSTLPKFKEDCVYCQVGEDELEGKDGSIMCDACAVEESIGGVGAEDFLRIECGIKLKRTGTLVLEGHESWTTYNSADYGYDYDQEFVVEKETWHHE